MPVYKDESNNGTWYVKCIYEDYTGTKHQKKKHVFKLQREAKEWEMNFLLKQGARPSMPFSALAELYLEDKKEHNKQITYETKKNRIEKWILPYFEKKTADSISATDVRKWQADLKSSLNANGTPLSPGDMQNLVTELSSIFNFAVKFYGLSVNPCESPGTPLEKIRKAFPSERRKNLTGLQEPLTMPIHIIRLSWCYITAASVLASWKPSQ